MVLSTATNNSGQNVYQTHRRAYLMYWAVCNEVKVNVLQHLAKSQNGLMLSASQLFLVQMDCLL